MGKYWRKMNKRLLRASLVLVMLVLFSIGLIASGYFAPPGIADILAIVVIILLGLIMIVLNWLIFEVNRIDRK